MYSFMDFLARLPIEWFVLFGSIIEEAISPIPSFLVLVPGGASLAVQHIHISYAIVLALLAALGRVIGGSFLYWIATVCKKQLFARRSHWCGVTLADIARLKKRLGKRKSWWMLFTMWTVPIFPGAPLSLGSGFIKVPWAIFATATFCGSTINALFYILVGYFGLKAAHALHAVELVGQIIGIALIIGGIVWFVWRKKKK